MSSIATDSTMQDHLWQQQLRELSHDMGAQLMLLESALRRLKGDGRTPQGDGDGPLEHALACLCQAMQLQGDMASLARTGTIDMAPQRVDLGALLADIVRQQEELRARRGAEIVVRGPLPAVRWHPQPARPG